MDEPTRETAEGRAEAIVAAINDAATILGEFFPSRDNGKEIATAYETGLLGALESAGDKIGQLQDRLRELRGTLGQVRA